MGTTASTLNNRSHPPHRNLLNAARFPGCCECKARMPQAQRASTHCCAWNQHLTLGPHHPHRLPPECPLPESPVTSHRCRSCLPYVGCATPTDSANCAPVVWAVGHGTSWYGPLPQKRHCWWRPSAQHPRSPIVQFSSQKYKFNVAGSDPPNVHLFLGGATEAGQGTSSNGRCSQKRHCCGYRRLDNRACLQSTRGPNNMGRTVRSQTCTP